MAARAAHSEAYMTSEARLTAARSMRTSARRVSPQSLVAKSYDPITAA